MTQTVALSVNLNKVALLRNARDLDLPSVTQAALWTLQAGAQGITVHPRPDERHIRARDAVDLGLLLRDWPQAEFNIEGNPHHNLLDVARAVRDAGGVLHQLTFVPDTVAQTTSDHGWNLAQAGQGLRPLIARAHALGARVSLFMDPVAEGMTQAADLGADRVELYTEAYARAQAGGAGEAALRAYAQAASAATEAGLGLNAGHDLNLHNLPPFVRAVPGLREVSIGHALTADALQHGWMPTVRAYLDALRRPVDEATS